MVGRSPDGTLHDAKLLSENPGAYDDAALAGIARLMGVRPGDPLPVGAIDSVRMGTTVATNALLQRRGVPTLFLVTAGFKDLLRIGDQARPSLFALHVRRVPVLPARVAEVGGRLDPDGHEVAPLDEAGARVVLARAAADGFGACAIALMHAWAHPRHELRLAALAREAGFAHVSASHEVDPAPRLVPRAQTTAVDAYLAPVLRRHVDRLHRALPGVRLSFMQSHGGLVRAERFRARDAILSGPAGGVVGAVRTAEAAGFRRIVGFDMGGTSTDVSLHEDGFERADAAVVDGVPVRAPTLAIETVAAGGGSILRFDGERLRVGPDSGGADPGPAAYRRGGEPTITDANILLGRIRVDRFPTLFGPDRDQPLDLQAVEAAFDRLAARFDGAGSPSTPQVIAAGAVGLAVQQMAEAIRRIGLRRGRDLDGFTLACFGGAGGQHACLVADELGLERIFIHPRAGLLSAYGMGLADQSILRRASVEAELDGDGASLHGLADRLERDARAALAEDGADPAAVTCTRTVQLRVAGSDAWLDVALAGSAEMRAAFAAMHRRRFGFAVPERALVVQAVLVEATAPGGTVDEPALPEREPVAPEVVPVWDGLAMRPTPLHDRALLGPGARVAGPALVAEANAMTVVEAGWVAEVDRQGGLVLTRSAPRSRVAAGNDGRPDPIRLALFNAVFMSVAEQMGAVLQNTALSVNIRERLDFSCALFDADGQLIANAPHVPVHLGAMGESVRHVLRVRGGRLRPGDSVALNDPFAGGTHLPDVTVVTPVFDDAGTLRCVVGSRGHHADIGGITPGSVPPFSTALAEEGVVLDDVLVTQDGRFREAELRALLRDAPWPARDPDTNVADLQAQIAANQAGIAALERVAGRYGWDTVVSWFGHVMDNGERAVRRLLDRLPDGARDYPLDDGAMLRVAVRVDRGARSAVIDFAGTGTQRPGNFNAPPAVVRASILYVLRCLLDDDLPLNDGCLRPVEIRVPEGSFLSPRPGAAVVSGNTELSQAVANALLGALGACASAQGTMNNLVFGDAARQYYETIGGGTGAGPGPGGTGFDGADGVQSHMTNTRMTDAEVLEMRLPVRVERFGVRPGSSGAGRRHGGDGLVRRLRFLQPMTVMLVSSRRTVAPFGLDGGADGAVGRQRVERADGTVEVLAGVAQAEMRPGDAIVVETPGGGGWGVG